MSSFLTISLLEESIYGFFLTTSSRYAGRLHALLATETAARTTTGETFTGEERCLPFLPFHY